MKDYRINIVIDSYDGESIETKNNLTTNQVELLTTYLENMFADISQILKQYEDKKEEEKK